MSRDYRPRANRFTYVLVAFGLAAAVAIGFSRTFFLRPFFHSDGLRVALLFHGAAMTAWMILVIVQAWLISGGRTRMHQALGMVGGAIAVSVVGLGTFTLFAAAARQAMPGSPDFLELLVAFDGLSLALFGVFAAAAIVFRRRSWAHKRFVVLATLSLLPPALGRITLLIWSHGNESAVLLAMAMLAFGLTAIDAFQQRRFHPVLVCGAIAIVASNALTYAAQAMP